MPQLDIVIPAYNEQASIADTVGTIRNVLDATSIDYGIIVVDDGSRDNTGEIASQLDVRLIRHKSNRGYGAALKTGIKASEASYIGIVDADGTYPIDRLPDLFEEIEATGSEHVIGARTGANVHDTPGRWVARRVLRLIAWFATGRWIPDLNSGMRVFSRELALQYWALYPNGFSFTTTITIASLQSRADVRFVPIDYFEREGKSHIKPVKDFFRFFALILRVSFIYAPLRFFVAPGALLFLAGLTIAVVQIIGNHGLADSAVITTLVGAQLLLNGLLAESLARLHLRRPIT